MSFFSNWKMTILVRKKFPNYVVFQFPITLQPSKEVSIIWPHWLMRLNVIYLGELSTVWVQLHLLFRSIRLTCTTVSWAAMTGHPQGLGLAWILQNRKWWRPWFHWQFFFISIQFVCLPYCKVAWINTSQLDAQVRVYRLLMKRKFDAYLFTAIFSGKVYLLLYMLLLATLPYMISIQKIFFGKSYI